MADAAGQGARVSVPPVGTGFNPPSAADEMTMRGSAPPLGSQPVAAPASSLPPPPSLPSARGGSVPPPGSFAPGNPALGRSGPNVMPNVRSGTVPSVNAQDLTQDKLLTSANRLTFNDMPMPCLGGIPLIAKLGQGGMGAVYYGIHPRLETEVAVKVLPFHLAERNPDLIQRFFREAKIAATIKSPHLIGVSDVNEEVGLFYLVMEFVDGQSAGGLLKRVVASGKKGLPEAMALDIIIAAVKGLAVAHGGGVIHRDIKPDNIMIPRVKANRTGIIPPGGLKEGDLNVRGAKLADLGLARSEEFEQNLTCSQVFMGTPGYMAPEQAMEARAVGAAADVFSMGATLYALLAGVPPFQAPALMATLNATCTKPHAPISEHRPDVSPAVGAVIDTCLAKDAAGRYPDANTLLQALSACRSTLSGSPEEDVEILSLPPVAAGAISPSRTGRTGLAATSIDGSKAPSRAGSVPQTAVEKRSGMGMGVKLLIAFFLMSFLFVVLAAACIGGYIYYTRQQEADARIKAEINAEASRKEAAAAAAKKEADAAQAELKAAREQKDLASVEQLLKKTQELEKAQLNAELAQKNATEAARATAEKAQREEQARQSAAIEAEKARARQYDEAIVKADTAIASKNWDEAEIQYRSALSLRSQDTAATDGLGKVAKLRAEDEIQKKQDMEFATALAAAEAHKTNNAWKQVLGALEQPLERLNGRNHPRRAQAEGLMAMARDRMKIEGEALDKFNQGQALLKAGLYDDAARDFAEAQKIWPDPPYRAELLAGIKAAEEGKFRAVDAKAREERFAGAMAEGRGALGARDIKTAEAAFGRALVEKPGDPAATEGLRQARAMNTESQAATYLAQAREIAQKEGKNFNDGYYYFFQNSEPHQRFESALTQAQNAKPGDPEVAALRSKVRYLNQSTPAETRTRPRSPDVKVEVNPGDVIRGVRRLF